MANIEDRERRPSIQVIGVPGGRGEGGRDKKTTNNTN